MVTLKTDLDVQKNNSRAKREVWVRPKHYKKCDEMHNNNCYEFGHTLTVAKCEVLIKNGHLAVEHDSWT
jgi:NAD-dependent dihydropyrimidine dehydrogenase PreA subunit